MPSDNPPSDDGTAKENPSAGSAMTSKNDDTSNEQSASQGPTLVQRFRQRRSRSLDDAYRIRRRHRILEDHFRVAPSVPPPPSTAPNKKVPRQKPSSRRLNNKQQRLVVLPGVPRHDPDVSRDLHDFFNLVVLVPIVVLNVMNWNSERLLSGITDILLGHDSITTSHDHKQSISQIPLSIGGYVMPWTLTANDYSSKIAAAWTGDWFAAFFYLTTAYFAIDLLWILIIPKCVKSPGTILQHHVGTYRHTSEWILELDQQDSPVVTVLIHTHTAISLWT